MKTVNIFRKYLKRIKKSDEISYKDIRIKHDYEKKLSEVTGELTVPWLVNDHGPMKEAKDIQNNLLSHFVWFPK